MSNDRNLGIGNMYKLSIITINLNNAEGLKLTIDSVLAQTNKDFEYIIIDGASTDGSVSCIKQALESDSSLSIKWISEKDTGIYNAMNKGIALAEGEYLLMLNSADYLVDASVVDSILPYLDGTDIVQGNIIVSRGNSMFIHKGYAHSELSLIEILHGDFPHQATFTRKSVFKDYGLFDESYRLISDYIFYVKALGFGRASFKYIDLNISFFDPDGLSSQNQAIQKVEEDRFNEEYIPPRLALCINENEKKSIVYDRLKSNRILWFLTRGLLRVESIIHPNQRHFVADKFQPFVKKDNFIIPHMGLKKSINVIRKFIGEHILFRRFPYAYAHYYYWRYTGKNLNYCCPKDFNEKLFWLARYWQDPRIVQCADKLAVRNYIEKAGFEDILTTIYAVYNTVDEIDISALPDKFVLKTNNGGGGEHMVFCTDKATLDIKRAREIINGGLHDTSSLSTCEYHYQYIEPKAYAEEFIAFGEDKLEIQFFCFNGIARHILVRNDLGNAASDPIVISYNMDWTRSKDRKGEDMSISIPRPPALDRMITIANTLAAPFPQVRIDLYLVGNKIYFGEMTFSTSGNILWNYTSETIARWGEELVLPSKIKHKWKQCFQSHISDKEFSS